MWHSCLSHHQEVMVSVPKDATAIIQQSAVCFAITHHYACQSGICYLTYKHGDYCPPSDAELSCNVLSRSSQCRHVTKLGKKCSRLATKCDSILLQTLQTIVCLQGLLQRCCYGRDLFFPDYTQCISFCFRVLTPHLFYANEYQGRFEYPYIQITTSTPVLPSAYVPFFPFHQVYIRPACSHGEFDKVPIAALLPLVHYSQPGRGQMLGRHAACNGIRKMERYFSY